MVRGVRPLSRFFFYYFLFFACGCPVVPAPFVEKTIFAPLYCLCAFVKDPLTIFMWVYFWALYSVSLIYLSIFSPIPHCLDYYSITVVLKSGYALTLFFSFNIKSPILSLLPLQINFRISLLISTQWFTGILIGIALNL